MDIHGLMRGVIGTVSSNLQAMANSTLGQLRNGGDLLIKGGECLKDTAYNTMNLEGLRKGLKMIALITTGSTVIAMIQSSAKRLPLTPIAHLVSRTRIAGSLGQISSPPSHGSTAPTSTDNRLNEIQSKRTEIQEKLNELSSTYNQKLATNANLRKEIKANLPDKYYDKHTCKSDKAIVEAFLKEFPGVQKGKIDLLNALVAQITGPEKLLEMHSALVEMRVEKDMTSDTTTGKTGQLKHLQEGETITINKTKTATIKPDTMKALNDITDKINKKILEFKSDTTTNFIIENFLDDIMDSNETIKSMSDTAKINLREHFVQGMYQASFSQQYVSDGIDIRRELASDQKKFTFETFAKVLTREVLANPNLRTQFPNGLNNLDYSTIKSLIIKIEEQQPEIETLSIQYVVDWCKTHPQEAENAARMNQ